MMNGGLFTHDSVVNEASVEGRPTQEFRALAKQNNEEGRPGAGPWRLHLHVWW